MNEDFVTYELAVKLKRKGFDKDTVHYYNELGQICVSLVDEGYPYPCPTISQVLKWLREEKKLHIVIDFDGGMNWYYQIALYGLTTYEKESEHKYNSYEQAVLAGIEYVLDNLI